MLCTYRHRTQALLNDVVAAASADESDESDAAPTSSPSQQTSIDAFLAQRLAYPAALYLGTAGLLLLLGLCLGNPEGRVAVGVLLAAVLRCVHARTFAHAHMPMRIHLFFLLLHSSGPFV